MTVALARVALLALGLVPTASSAIRPPAPCPWQADDAEELGADEVAQALLDARRSPTSTADLMARLARGGPTALPPLFDVLTRERFDVRVGERGNSTKPLTESERQALVATFGRLPWAQVLVFLEERLAAAPDDAQRCAALAVVGAHGSTPDVRLLLEWTDPEEGRRRVARAVREAFEAALTSFIDREPEVLRAVPRLYANAHLSLVPAVLGALSSRPSAESLAALAELLSRIPDADAFVLAEIGHLGKSVHHPIDPATRDRVRPYLLRIDRVLLTEAISASAKLEDTDAVPLLIELLEHEDRSIRERTREALVEITSQQIGADPKAWAQWHEAVTEWWLRRAPDQMGLLDDGRPALVSRAIFELSKQRYYRHEIALPLCRALSRDEQELVVLACASLGHLGSVLAVPDLLDLLEDDSVEIRRAAFLALRRITGEDHGEDPERWRNAGW